jgi:hypothetical protein
MIVSIVQGSLLNQKSTNLPAASGMASEENFGS